MNKKQTIVDFIIAGAGKSGTRTLNFYLENHSEICMADGMEPKFFTEVKKNNFFSNDGNWSKGLDWYQSLFPNSEKLKGESSVIYFNTPDAAENIHKIAPNVKLVFLLREPVKRVYSHYWQERKTGSIPNISFDEMIKQQHPRLQRYFQHSSYQENLERFLKFFPKENIKILISEEFFKNPKNVVNSLCEFLDINSVESLEKVVKNKSAMPRSRVLDQSIRSIRQLRKQLNLNLPKPIHNIGQRMLKTVQHRNLKQTTYDKMSNDVEQELNRKFQKDILFVESFLDHQVSVWNKSVEKNAK